MRECKVVALWNHGMAVQASVLPRRSVGIDRDDGLHAGAVHI